MHHKGRGLFAEVAGSGLLRLVGLPFNALFAIYSSKLIFSTAGGDVYGYINLIAQLFTLLPFADLGLGAGITQAVARRGLSDHDKVVAWWTIIRSFRLLLFVSAIGIVASIAFAFFGVWNSALGFPDSLDSDASYACGLTVSIFFLGVPFACGQRILVGLGKSTIYAAFAPLPSLLNLLAVLLMSTLGFGSIWLSIGSTIGVTSVNVMYFLSASRVGGYSIRRMLSDVFQCSRSDEPQILLHQSAVPNFVLAVATAFIMNGGRVVASHTVGGFDLTAYSLVMQLVQPIWSVIYFSSTSLWSRFAVDLSSRSWLLANTVFGAIGIAAGFSLVTLGPFVVDFMADGGAPVHVSLFLSFAAFLVSLSLNATQSMILTDSSGLLKQAVSSVVASIFGLFGAALYAPRFGIVAVPIALSISVFVFQTIPLSLAVARKIGGSSGLRV